MSKQELKQRGFTIIEVVLVLAIAALIFLMVFIALPALQRSQRDTARKNDVSIVSSAVSTWQGNNRATAKWPTSARLKDYASNVSGNTTSIDSTADANGNAPIFNASPAAITMEHVVVYPASTCDTVSPGGKVTLKKGTARQYAVVTRLESGNESGYCLDS